jgi:hypothetical protein
MTVRVRPTTPLFVAMLGLLTACPDDSGASDPSTDTSGAAEGTTTDSSGAQSAGDTAGTTAAAESTGEATTDDPTDAPSTGGGVSFCGDDVAEGSEACDGTDLIGEDCVSLGFDGGRLACGARCAFDTSACTIACGNGVVDDAVDDAVAEDCDGDDLDGEDCASLGFDAGTLACAADCTFDVGGCLDAVCGDDAIEGPEACDGADLGVEDCISLGYDGGEIACDDACSHDVSGCTGTVNCCEVQDASGCGNGACEGAVCGVDPFCCDTQWDGLCVAEAFSLCPEVCPAVCGDGIISGDEACDAGNLGEQTCEGLGSPAGTLACDGACQFDTTGCDGQPGPCCTANGVAGCEDAACQDAVCELDAFCCDLVWDGQCADEAGAEPACIGLPSCPDALPVCGDGVLGAGELCDGADLGGETCVSQGVLSSCCVPHDGMGCDDEACEATICAFDAFCCENAWDGQCAGQAADNCAVLCAGGVLGCAVGCDAFDVSGC